MLHVIRQFRFKVRVFDHPLHLVVEFLQSLNYTEHIRNHCRVTPVCREDMRRNEVKVA